MIRSPRRGGPPNARVSRDLCCWLAGVVVRFAVNGVSARGGGDTTGSADWSIRGIGSGRLEPAVCEESPWSSCDFTIAPRLVELDFRYRGLLSGHEYRRVVARGEVILPEAHGGGLP